MSRKTLFSSLYLRFIVFYSILLILPIGVMGILVSGRYSDTYRDEILAVSNANIERIRAAGDNALKQVFDIAYLLSENEYAQRFYYGKSPYVAQKLIGELKKFSATGEVVHDILFVFRGHPYIYGSDSSYTPTTLREYFYPFTTETYDLLMSPDLIYPATIPLQNITLPNGENISLVIYAYPVPVDASFHSDAIIVFLLDASKLFNLLLGESKGEVDWDEGITLNILDANANYIAGSSERTADSDTVHFGSTLELISISPETNFQYHLSISDDPVDRKFRAIRNGFLLALTAIVVIGAILIVVFMRFSYGPIGRLSDYVQKLTMSKETRDAEDATADSNIHEIAFIQSSVERMLNEIHDMRQWTSDSNEAIKEQVVFQLLQGKITNADLIRRFTAETGITMNGLLFSVAVILVHKTEIDLSVIDILHWLEESLKEQGIDAIGRPTIGQETSVLVLAHNMYSAAEIRTALDNVRSDCQEVFDIRLSIGLGTHRNKLRDIPASYIEAASALDYRLISGTGMVICYETIAETVNIGVQYPSAEIARVREALEDEDVDAVELGVLAIVHRLRELRPSLVEARTIIFSVLNMIVNRVVFNVPTIESRIDTPDIFSIINICTFEDLARTLIDFSNQLGDELAGRQSVSQHGREILSYIEQNFADANFSVQKVAEQFQYSHTSLNDFFKHEFASTPGKIINDARMRRAKHLLRTTRMPLKQIVKAVGYSDTSNFIRKFREVENKTPGAYRKVVLIP